MPSSVERGPLWPLWGERSYLMGIINLTPDSFSGDGIMGSPGQAADRAEELVFEGADVLDLGGESTRPGFTPISVEEEMERVLPALDAIVPRVAVPVSIDTSKAQVAERALDSGASIVNDVSGLADPSMLEVVRRHDAGLVVVHNRQIPSGADTMAAIISDLDLAVEAARHAGIAGDRIVVDPGFGFGKGPRRNLEMIRRLGELRTLSLPILLGPSRKGTIGKVLPSDPQDRMEGTCALVTLAIAQGADMLRVHDVPAMTRAARMTDAIVRRPS